MILEKIHTRADLLALTDAEQAQLCREIRDFLVRHVSQTGGHLASNLGVVELTVAIERVFDTKKDRLVLTSAIRAMFISCSPGARTALTD